MTRSQGIWAREYLCVPPPRSEPYRRAYTLWCVAHALMEREDRKYCSGTGHEGEAIPVTGWERAGVNRTGRAMYKVLRFLAPCFQPEEWEAAKRDTGRLSIRTWERVADENPAVVEEVRSILYAVFPTANRYKVG